MIPPTRGKIFSNHFYFHGQLIYVFTVYEEIPESFPCSREIPFISLMNARITKISKQELILLINMCSSHFLDSILLFAGCKIKTANMLTYDIM